MFKLKGNAGVGEAKSFIFIAIKMIYHLTEFNLSTITEALKVSEN